MKKRIIFLVAACLLALMPSGIFAAEEEQVTAYVTIADAKGEIVLAKEATLVKDRNGDGIYTLEEALYAAHEAHYEGGAQAGFASYASEYGLSLGMLWGDDSGAFGYYQNHQPVNMGLAAVIANGDEIDAFVYSDTVAYSDIYCYFDAHTLSARVGDSITLCLMAAGYDAEWNPISYPLVDATILIDGEATEVKTDEAGKATIALNRAGELRISAKSEGAILVPPVCNVTVEQENNNAVTIVLCMCGAGICVASAVLSALMNRKKAKQEENEA